MTPPQALGWNLELIGIAWWLVLPLAGLAGWGILRLMRAEVARLPGLTKRLLAWLRGSAVVVVVLFLLEPTLTFQSTERELPAVAVLIDRSGSMAVTDAQMSLSHRLDEAVTLGFIEPALRPEAARRARQEMLALSRDLPMLSAAVVATQEAWAHGQTPGDREAGIRMADLHAERARQALPTVNHPEATAFFTAQADVLGRVLALLRRTHADAGGDQPEAIAAALGGLGERCTALLPKLDAAQAASDQALLADATANLAVKDGLLRLGKLTRFERAAHLVHTRLSPVLAGRAKVDVFAIDDGELAPLRDLGTPAEYAAFAPAGSTDFAAPLSTLARKWADQQHVGGVVLLSDGRQTAGTDPRSAVRALTARGARLAGIMVGDVEVPRDAVVAEVQAPPEVFSGETVRLDARFRITGYPEQEWSLVLTKDGKACDRRLVRGTGQWQSERFEQPDAEAGVHNYQVRLEREARAGSPLGGGGLSREVWTGIPGVAVGDLVGKPAFAGKPLRSDVVSSAESADLGGDYGARLRGFVVPPQSGNYVFWITADDQAELWLSAGSDPAKKIKIAEVRDWAERGKWDKYPSQRSPPVALEKGQAYYIEALHKQGGGQDHVGIGWSLPDGRQERPIAGEHLAPFSPESAQADGKQPAESTAAEGDAQAEASLANNQADCSVTVNDDPLKVLVVDATPRWESRFLVTMFERDRRVEVTRRYRSVRLARNERELLPPTQEALDAYDLVVLGDLAPGEVGAEDQQHLERFVSRRGGFVVCIAGPRGMPAAYGLGGIANLLPVRVGSQTANDATPATVAMTKASQENPIVSILDEPALNRTLWPALPPLQWIAQGVVAKPGSDVLLESQNDARVPVVAASRFGAGRVLWVGSPETWRWRDRVGERVHQTFWLQAVRWGLGIRLRGKDDRLQVALDRSLIAPSEAAELRVRARHADGRAIESPTHARLQRLDDQGEPIAGTERDMELIPVLDADGLWQVTVNGLDEGRWRITVTSPDADLAGRSEVRDLVVRAHQSQEGIELGADLANLNRLANAGNFRADTIDQAVALVSELAEHLEPTTTTRRTTHSLWDNYLALLLVVGLLSVEWILRKRVGLP